MDRFGIACDWVRAFVESAEGADIHLSDYIEESAAILIAAETQPRKLIELESVGRVDGLLGDHSRVDAKSYELDYHGFSTRLSRYEQETVPAFEAYTELKKDLVAERREQLRLSEFKPRVLTSFVRNQLINDTYPVSYTHLTLPTNREV